MSKDIIVIPDVHGRQFWKEAVEKYPEADTIFLGDYLDAYHHENIKPRETYKNFLEILDYAKTNENVTLLFGNHDLVYWFNYDWGRRDNSRGDEILEVFRNNLSLFRLYAVREVNGGKWLFSHAPLFEEWLEKTGLPHDIADHEPIIWKLLEKFNRNSEAGYAEIRPLHDAVWGTLARASSRRGGIDKCGSPVWADVNEILDGCTLSSEFDYFVFGHTQLNHPIITDKFACLDSRQAFKITPTGVIEPITEQKAIF